MKILTRFQSELLREYNRTRKTLRNRLKRPMAPADVNAFINDSIIKLTERQAPIIARYIYRMYKSGIAEAKKELKGVTITAAASLPDMGDVGFRLDEVSQQHMNRIFHNNLGAIGDYNEKLSKTLQTQYNTLLSDNKLIHSLNTHGWTPRLEGEWKKRGIAPEIIELVKGQKTTKQMINILELHGIKGGMHPNQVAKKLIPHINRFFGPEGVVIDNVGKMSRRFEIDADGNYRWIQQKVTKKYKATTKTYSRLIARNTIKQAHMDAYYDSTKKSGMVDYYISVALMDSTTCGMCAMMHGQRVTKGSGPQYHGNCGCDLRPVWKKDSVLAKTNKPEEFYNKQRDIHFLRANDLKMYNAKMPRGMKLKYATQLPEDAITHVMPGKIKMRAIRHEMMEEPAAIKPIVKVKPPVPDKTLLPPQEEKWALSDKDWKTKADELYKKTTKDGNEHMQTFNGVVKEFMGNKNSCKFKAPVESFYSIHTHPGWDSPLSSKDFITTLHHTQEKVSGAASKKAIYIIRRADKTINIESRLGSNVFMREWDNELDRIMWAMDEKNRKNADMTKVYLKVGKIMAKKFNLEYKVIKR